MKAAKRQLEGNAEEVIETTRRIAYDFFEELKDCQSLFGDRKMRELARDFQANYPDIDGLYEFLVCTAKEWGW